jgi:hypothetical protein
VIGDFMSWKVGRMIGVYVSEKGYETKEEADEVYQRLLENYEYAESSGMNWHPLTRVSKPWLYEEKTGDLNDE